MSLFFANADSPRWYGRAFRHEFMHALKIFCESLFTFFSEIFSETFGDVFDVFFIFEESIFFVLEDAAEVAEEAALDFVRRTPQTPSSSFLRQGIPGRGERVSPRLS